MDPEIADFLLRSRDLLDSALARIGEPDADAAARITPRADWSDTLRRRLRDTRREVILAVSDPLRAPGPDPAGEALLQKLIDTGKQVRVLLSARYAAGLDPYTLPRAGGMGERIRVTGNEFHNTMVIDQHTAVLWTEVNGRSQAYLTTDYTLLGAIYQFATQTWAAALPLADHLSRVKRDFGEPAIAVLRFLRAGVTDEVAARGLSVSARTYRRYVAELMERLQVTTRFQLGVRAAELGLLDPA